MKTHVSKISSGSQAHGFALREVKSHKDFKRLENQNLKMANPKNLVSIFCQNSDLTKLSWLIVICLRNFFLSHEEELVRNPYLATFSFGFFDFTHKILTKFSRDVIFK